MANVIAINSSLSRHCVPWKNNVEADPSHIPHVAAVAIDLKENTQNQTLVHVLFLCFLSSARFFKTVPPYAIMNNYICETRLSISFFYNIHIMIQMKFDNEAEVSYNHEETTMVKTVKKIIKKLLLELCTDPPNQRTNKKKKKRSHSKK